MVIYQNGIYTINVKNEFGCDKFSDIIKIQNIGFEKTIASTFQIQYIGKNLLYIESNEQITNIDIYGIQGNTIEHLKITNNIIDLNHLPTAFYIIQIKNQNFKILVQ